MPSMKAKTRMIESLVDDRRPLKNDMREVKVYEEEDSRNLVAKTLAISNRTLAQKPLMGIRKSVPSNMILRQHGNDENAEASRKRDISVECKGGRKALADVSNLKSNLLRGRMGNSGSKSMAQIRRRTTDFASSSRKPILDVKKVNDSQITELHVHDSVPGKGDVGSDLNLSEKIIDDKYLSSLDVNVGKTLSKPPLAARKSAASQRINKAYSLGPSTLVQGKGPSSKLGSTKVNTESSMKTNVRNSKKHMEKPSISEIKTRRKASVKITSMKCRTQTGNDSKLMNKIEKSPSQTRFASASQNKALNSSSRKLLTTSRKMSSKARVARVALKFKVEPGLEKKSMPRMVNSSTEVQGANVSTIDKIKPVIPHEFNVERGPTDSNECSIQSAITITSKPKTGRRRSYTSLLMARSKVLGEIAGVTKQHELPSIDDSSNPLEVAEYVDDIYQYYWFTETTNPSLANYMAIQTEVNFRMRGILVNWLIEVHFKFELMPETLFLMVELLDRYLSAVIIKKDEMQLVGLTALLLASKYEDFWHPKVKDLIGISSDLYTRGQLLDMEKLILKKLSFRLNAPTPYVFMLRFLKASQADKKLEHLAFYLIELCLVEYEALEFKPSLLCAAAIYLARCTLQMSPCWTELLIKHSRYDELQLRSCAEMILRFQKAAGRGLLKVTYEKYLSTDCSCVAKIKPIDGFHM